MACKRSVTNKSGFSIPAIGLGTWQSTEEECERAINGAMQAGYNLIDTANFYQNEATIGKVLKQWIDSGKVKREDLFVVTKLSFSNKPEDIDKLMDASLKNLQLSYVDLYLIHGPFTLIPKEDGSFGIDHSTDIIAIYKAMERQVTRGKARAVGLSNFNKNQVERILKIATIPPAVNQIELHAYLQQPDLVQYLKSKDIMVMAYSPLASRGSSTFYKEHGVNNKTLPDLFQNPVVLKLSEKYKKSPAQLLLRHLIQKDIIAIPKSGNPKRIAENIDIFDFEIGADDMKTLNGLNCNKRVVIFTDVFPGLSEHPEYPFKDEL